MLNMLRLFPVIRFDGTYLQAYLPMFMEHEPAEVVRLDLHA